MKMHGARKLARCSRQLDSSMEIQNANHDVLSVDSASGNGDAQSTKTKSDMGDNEIQRRTFSPGTMQDVTSKNGGESSAYGSQVFPCGKPGFT